MNQYNLLLLAFRISHNLLRNNEELKKVGDIHNHNTRQRNQYYVETYETSFGFDNFFTRGLIAYNNLDSAMENMRTIEQFKRELRHRLYETYLSEN